MSDYENLITAIENLEANVNSGNYDDELATTEYHTVLEMFENSDPTIWEEHDLSKITGRLNKLKGELEIYDPEDELDSMFPDRHDEDFDEDAISGSSFFKIKKRYCWGAFTPQQIITRLSFRAPLYLLRR